MQLRSWQSGGRAGIDTGDHAAMENQQRCRWWEAWSGHSRMNLSSTARCRPVPLLRRPLRIIGQVAEPHGWVRWKGTVRTVARSRTPRGQMRVRERVWYRVGPLTDRTKAEDRIFVGFRMKSSAYILIANGEATTAPTIRRRPVSERWANPEEIINVPVWPWDRPGHQ